MYENEFYPPFPHDASHEKRYHQKRKKSFHLSLETRHRKEDLNEIRHFYEIDLYWVQIQNHFAHQQK